MEKKKRTGSKIYAQVRKNIVLGIVIALLLSLGASLIISLTQESTSRDQMIKTGAQIAASTPVLIENTDITKVNEYIRRTVVNVPSIDVLAVYDTEGNPISFYDLATGSDDITRLEPLSPYIIEQIKSNDEPLIYNQEAPHDTDRCAYSAILSDDGEITGYAMAGIYTRSVQKMIMKTLLYHLIAAAAALVFGSFLTLQLSKRIKDDLLGYEPDDFRQIFLQRMDILDGLEEGLLAIDTNSNITYINKAASEMLNTDIDEAVGKNLNEIYPFSTIPRVMKTGKPEYNVNLKNITDVSIMSDRIPLWHEGKIKGVIAIFRNRTEVTGLAQELTGVQHIVEALRAYTHEFTNKLHVILGLLQLGETKRAEDYVLRITQTRSHSIDYISERIHDPSIAALLIGKQYRAAELDIKFTLEQGSTLSGDGRFIPRPALITVLGNLIENAFEAMRHTPSSSTAEVTVSVRDGSHGLLISVDDTGPGMIPEVREHIFERGYSTKGDGHGVGLALVYEIVEAYHGTMRVESEPGIGTSFIITFTEANDGI